MSEKPVLERLQVKGARRLSVLHAPPDVDAAVGGGDRRATVESAEVVLTFARMRDELEARVAEAKDAMRPDAILWVAYAKKASRLAGDIDRDVIWAYAQTVGLETVASIAIDADWSALRLKRAS